MRSGTRRNCPFFGSHTARPKAFENINGSTFHRHRKVAIALVGRESKADVHRSMHIMHPLQSL